MLFLTFPRSFVPGDYVVFSMAKRSAHPGARARNIRPELHGEGYRYLVDKFWIVHERRGTQVVLMTRRGKIHVVDENHPHLHRRVVVATINLPGPFSAAALKRQAERDARLT